MLFRSLHSVAGAAWRLWGLDAGGRFQAGVGLRASHYFADAAAYDSQNGTEGLILTVAEPRSLALNAAFQVRARVAGPVSLGFNLDLVGVSVGPLRPGQYSGNTSALPPVLPPVVPLVTEPVTLNLLRGGLADQGSLNSELYAGLALPRGFGLRLGYCHLVTAQAADDTRYRRFRNLASVGLSWQLPN